MDTVDTSTGPDPVDDEAVDENHPLLEGGGDGDPDGDGDATSTGQRAADEGGGADWEPPRGNDPLRFNNWMKRSTTGAVMTGIALGLQHALEARREKPAFVMEAPDDPDAPIDLRFDPDNPANTVAIIRGPVSEHPPHPPPSGS